MTAGLMQAELNRSTLPETAAPQAWPSSFGERVEAAWNAGQTEDRYWNQRRAYIDHGNALLKDVQALTGKKLANPFDMQPTQEEISANLGAPIPAIMAKRMEVLKKTTADLRGQYRDMMGQMPDSFLNEDAIPGLIADQSRAAREHAESLEGTGHGVAAFLGGAGAEMVSPHNILGLPLLGATALPRAAAQATLGAWALNILKEGGFQAIAQTALQVPGTILDYAARKEVGTEPTAREMMGELASVAAGGFLLGGAARTLHGILTKLKLAGIELPPDVKDAAIAVEGDALYGNKNPMGMPAAQFEKVQDDALADVLVAKRPSWRDRPEYVPEPGEPAPNISTGEERLDPELKAEVDKVAKMADETPPETKPITTPEPPAAGQPVKEGPTPEELALVDAARKQVEEGTLKGGAEFARDMELHDAQERGLAALARHCGIGKA